LQISEGFMEHESLHLMADCVGVEISQLPPQAKKIHQLCKGNVSVYTNETVWYTVQLFCWYEGLPNFKIN